MKYITFFLACFFMTQLFCQSSSWAYEELSKGFKIKVPDEMEERIVRDLRIFQIDNGNYDWKIISMSSSSFTKDNPEVNFLGQVKNISNKIHQDPYTILEKDSLFLLKGTSIYYTLSKTMVISDRSQDYRTFRFYVQIGGQVYISNFKYFKESKVKFEHFANFFEEMKLPKNKQEMSLKIKGEKTFFEIDRKSAFLKEVYCNYPKIEKSKSYHEIFSLNVSLKLTETGKVNKVELDPSKMILITRESENKLVDFFSNYNFTKIDKEKMSSENSFDFVLFLDEASKESVCK